ncbi:MAG: DUF309 domain-containing protein [Pararhodobacter sp.]
MIPLPVQPHLPGRNARPDPALFAPVIAGLEGLDAAELEKSPAFAAGFGAFGAGFYWEAHEFWEAVWAALPPASAERQVLRGLIQLANAGLKRRMGREVAAARILVLADAALGEGFGGGRGRVMGVERETVAAMRAQVAPQNAI